MSPRAGAPGSRFAFLVFVLAILVPVAFMLYTDVRDTDVVRRLTGPPTIGPESATSQGPIALTDLPSIGDGERPVDAPPPPGGYGAFDAVLQLPWALTVALAWAPDARLDRIDVQRVHPDGLIDAQEDAAAEAQYRFVSPALEEELRRQATRSSDAALVTALVVRVHQGHIGAKGVRTVVAMLQVRDDNGPSPADPHALPLSETFKRLSRRTAFNAPSYTGSLINVDPDGWVWYFSTPSGATLPRVRSTDAGVLSDK